MFNKRITQAVIVISFISVLSLTSCSTTIKLIKHGKLEVETKMSDTVFLDPIADNTKTVLLQIKNTTDKSGLDIESKLKTAVQSKGYRVVTSPDAANIMIQANILQVGKSNLEDPFQILTSGYGSGLAGFAAGATLGGALGGTGRSMLGTGLLFGASEAILDAAVEVVTFTMITDLQISERRSPAQQNASGKFVDESSDTNLKQGTSGMKKSTWKEKTNWKKYQTRIMSVAKKTNLKFEQAEPELVSGLVSSIAGIL